MKFLNAFYIVLHCFGINMKIPQSRTLLTQLEMKENCKGHQFKYVAHHLNKNMYFLCVPGKAIEMSCGYGKCFNDNDLNYPCAKCNSTIADNDIKVHCNKFSTEPLDRAYIQNDCKSYYVCMGRNEDPLLVKCLHNQYFSVEQKMCVHNTKDSCTPVSKWCEDKPDGASFPLTSCHMYYQCKSKKTEIKTCEYGFNFDNTTSRCVSGICEQDMRLPDCKLRSNGFKMHHKECNKFYECSGQIPIERQCPMNEHFDGTIRICVDKDRKVCKE